MINTVDVEYGEEESIALRTELIYIRDEALKRGDFQTSIILSHVIGWMAIAIKQLFKENKE